MSDERLPHYLQSWAPEHGKRSQGGQRKTLQTVVMADAKRFTESIRHIICLKCILNVSVVCDVMFVYYIQYNDRTTRAAPKDIEEHQSQNVIITYPSYHIN